MNYLVANAQNTNLLEVFGSGLVSKSFKLNFAQRIISENMTAVFSGQSLNILAGIKGGAGVSALAAWV